MQNVAHGLVDHGSLLRRDSKGSFSCEENPLGDASDGIKNAIILSTLRLHSPRMVKFYNGHWTLDLALRRTERIQATRTGIRTLARAQTRPRSPGSNRKEERDKHDEC